MTSFTISNENFSKIQQLNDLITEYNALSSQLKSVEKKIRTCSAMTEDDSITDVIESVNAAEDRIATIAALAGFIA